MPALVAGVALALAFVLGAVASRIHFCTIGAATDSVNFGDWRGMRMWVLAIAIAIAGSAGLAPLRLIDLSKALYATLAVGSILAYAAITAGRVAVVRNQTGLDRMA